MKTKILLLIVFAVLFSCKKKEPVAPPVKKEPIKISKEEFAVLAADFANKKGLPENTSRFVLKTGYNILGIDSTIKGARVKNFPLLWTYQGLKPILIENPLSVQLICKSGSLLQIENLEEFLTLYGPEDGTFRVWPKPRDIVEIGADIFLIGYAGKPWKTRQQAK